MNISLSLMTRPRRSFPFFARLIFRASRGSQENVSRTRLTGHEAWFVGGKEALFSRSEVDVSVAKRGETDKFKIEQFNCENQGSTSSEILLDSLGTAENLSHNREESIAKK
jgi:hypothetical protein